jgi:hypothetical protein
VVALAAPSKGQLTPVLERRLGEWESALVAKTRGGPETKVEGRSSIGKAYDGTFLLTHSDNNREGGELYELATFDPDRKAYRMWTYTAQGSIFEWDGTWDEKARVMTWNAALPTGLTGVLRWTFDTDDKMGHDLVVKMGPFTAFTAAGTLTRKPK